MSARVRFTREERLDQIIEEATVIIGRSGYHGFSVQELADQCGITVGGLLHHVGTKEKLLIKVLQRRDEDDIEAVSGTPGALEFGATPTSVEKAIETLDRLVERNYEQPDMVRLYAILRQESLDEGHPAHEYFVERDKMVLDTFEVAFEPFVRDPRSFARQMFALMGGLEEQWLRDLDHMDLVAEWKKGRSALLQSSLLDASVLHADARAAVR